MVNTTTPHFRDRNNWEEHSDDEAQVCSSSLDTSHYPEGLQRLCKYYARFTRVPPLPARRGVCQPSYSRSLVWHWRYLSCSLKDTHHSKSCGQSSWRAKAVVMKPWASLLFNNQTGDLYFWTTRQKLVSLWCQLQRSHLPHVPLFSFSNMSRSAHSANIALDSAFVAKLSFLSCGFVPFRLNACTAWWLFALLCISGAANIIQVS